MTRPIVTIFSDASFRPDGRAGWGAVALRAERRVHDGGRLPDGCMDPQDAELQAAVRALGMAADSDLLQGRPVVVLQMDSTEAIRTILGACRLYRYSPSRHDRDVDVVHARPGHPNTRRYDLSLSALRCIHDEYEISLLLRHVKGHRESESGRHALNGIVDRMARAGALGD